MQWGAPELLHLLWLAPVIALLTVLLWRRRERQLAMLLDGRALENQLPPTRRRRQQGRLALWVIALTLGLIALARPQWGEREIEARHMGLDILFVVDTSNSMRAEDMRPNRLQRAKLGIRDMLPHLRGDRVGLIPFAGDSYLYCPLTADYSAFLMMLDDLYPGIVPRGGTAIEQALRKAMHSFDDHVDSDRVIILITDGEDHEGNPLDLVPELRRRGIRLFAVGVGSTEAELIPITNDRGQQTVLRDRQGNVVQTRLDEAVLERLATRTDGIYIRATSADFGLETIHREGILPLQRELMETHYVIMHEERYAWLLGAALLLLLIEAALRDGRRPSSTRVAMALVGLTMLWSATAHAESPRPFMQEGLEAFERQDYEEAAEAFRNAARHARDTRLDPARASYNLGNALYQLGRFDEAVGAYQDALRSVDLDLQQTTHFNKGNAHLEHGRQLTERQQLEQALKSTEQALESYRNALTLKPDDRDAKINYELAEQIKEAIEELIEQQPEPEPQPGEGDEEEPQPDDEGEPGDEPDSQQQPPPPEPGEQEPGEQPEPSIDEMTDEEIEQLLNFLKDEEQATRDAMRLPLGDPELVEKDW